MSLSKASEIAGMDIEYFQEIQDDRGVEMNTAASTAEELGDDRQYLE